MRGIEEPVSINLKDLSILNRKSVAKKDKPSDHDVGVYAMSS
jgi:hypothetical protein